MSVLNVFHGEEGDSNHFLLVGVRQRERERQRKFWAEIEGENLA